MKEITSIAEARQQQLDEQARRDFIKGWIPRLRKEYEAVLIGLQQMVNTREAANCLDMLIHTTGIAKAYIEKCDRLSELRQL